MIRYTIVYISFIIGLSFGDNNLVHCSLQQATHFTRTLSICFTGGTYFTFSNPTGFRGFLPDLMWRGGGRIDYQSTPHFCWSLTGGYSYTKNIDFVFEYPPLHDVKFEIINASCLAIYTIADNHYQIGGGLDILFIKYLYDSTVDSEDRVCSTTFLTPLVSIGIQYHISHSLYVKLHADSKFYHLAKFGAEELYLRDILVSISIDIGYSFSL